MLTALSAEGEREKGREEGGEGEKEGGGGGEEEEEEEERVSIYNDFNY